MPRVWRIFRPALLAVLVLTLALPLVSVSAQDGDETQPVVIQGTPELEELVGAVRDAYLATAPDAEVVIDPRGGQRGGFEALCRGEVDIVMSTEPVSDAQLDACASAGEDVVEVVLAYEAVVLLASPQAGLTCIERADAEALWQLGADPALTWDVLGSLELAEPVEVLGRDPLAPPALLLRTLVAAGELRDDAEVVDDPEALLARVTADESTAVGFMSLAELAALDPEGAAVPLSVANEAGFCVAPSPATVVDGSYPLARADYLYVNAANAARAEVQDFLEFALLDEAGAPSVAVGQGYTPADDAAYAMGANNVRQGRAGRTFTRPLTPVGASSDEAGDVVVVGSPMLGDITLAVRSAFSGRYPSANVQMQTFGNDAGWQVFCSGEADVLQATRPATDEELALCADNGIEPYTIDLGYQGLVLAAPGDAAWAECVTPDALAALLRAGTDESPAAVMWSEVDAAWPEREVLLVTPPRRTGETDYLIARFIGDLTLNVRADVAEHNDALYRWQGVANTDNALTYGWWTAVQDSEADVRLLALDAGEGCVAPSPETFADGTYPLAFPVQYHFSQASLGQPLVRALLWQFFDAATLDFLTSTPFVGQDLDAMRTTQADEVFRMLAELEAQAPADEEADTGDEGEDGTETPEAEDSAPAEDPAADAEATTAPTDESSTEDAGAEAEGDAE